MIKKSCSVLVAAFLMGLASCSDENPWLDAEGGQGAIQLVLTTDTNVRDAVPQTKAEEDNGLFKKPESKDFNIHLKRADGSTHTHETHDTFVELIKSATFPTGAYTIMAYSGRLEDEGFDKPYFEGTTEITVLENKTTVAQVEARLANTMISVEYTDAFKSYMKDYKATVHSEGYSYIDIEKTETRPAFVVPGNVSLSIDFTDPQGKSLKLQPAEFEAKPGYRYHVTLDVNNGEAGVAQLAIKFDSNLQQETVTIDLTDELFSAPEPSVKLKAENALADSEGVLSYELMAGTSLEGENRFTVISYGMIRDVKLTLKGYNKDSELQGDINLIGASPSVQSKLSALGLDCKGLFRNPDKMAYIDFSRFPANVEAGEYEISVVAHDMLGRESQAQSVRFNCISPEVTIKEGVAYSSTFKADIIVNYNGSNPRQELSFLAWNAAGMFERATILSCEEASTRAIEGKDYRVELQLPDFGKRSFERIAVYLNGQLAGEKDIEVKQPVTFEPDAFATKVLFKVVDPEGNEADIVKKVKISAEGGAIEESRINRDDITGIITITGLNPDHTYSYTFSGYNAEGHTYEAEFTTETAAALPNGDFSSMTRSISIDLINAGGIYTYSFVLSGTYRNKTSIAVDTPEGWGNINNITCDYEGSANKNTWYVVPSTLGDTSNKTVSIRTVGYSHNGVEPDSWKSTIHNFYSQNSPSRESFDVAAGQLFLGNDAIKGASFTTRPSEVAFEYSYAPINGESAKVEVNVYSGNEVIGSGQLTFGQGSSQVVPVSYKADVFGKKATSLSIVFLSSAAASPEIDIPTGAALKDNDKRDAPDNNDVLDRNNPDKNGTILATNTYNSKAIGSVLTLSNVKLNY